MEVCAGGRGAGVMETRLTFSFAFLDWRNQRRGELFVEGEEVLDALAVVLEGLRAVAEVDGAIKIAVGFG